MTNETVSAVILSVATLAGGALVGVFALGGGFDAYEIVDRPLPELPIRALDGEPIAFDGRPWLINVWLPG